VEWTESGGGTSSFFAAESEAFLEFIASHLPDPSHELTACRFEEATLRAGRQAAGFTPPNPDLLPFPRGFLRRGSSAGIVVFHGEPHAIIEALTKRQTLPPVSANTTAMLFGPGLEGLCRLASQREVELWRNLAAPVSFIALVLEGYSTDDVAPMLRAGILEFVADDDDVNAHIKDR
jgi:hypothetical protein